MCNLKIIKKKFKMYHYSIENKRDKTKVNLFLQIDYVEIN